MAGAVNLAEAELLEPPVVPPPRMWELRRELSIPEPHPLVALMAL